MSNNLEASMRRRKLDHERAQALRERRKFIVTVEQYDVNIRSDAYGRLFGITHDAAKQLRDELNRAFPVDRSTT